MARSLIGFEIHPGSAALVDTAKQMRDHGKQPAEIIEVLLRVYAEEPPADLVERALTTVHQRLAEECGICAAEVHS